MHQHTHSQYLLNFLVLRFLHTRNLPVGLLELLLQRRTGLHAGLHLFRKPCEILLQTLYTHARDMPRFLQRRPFRSQPHNILA